MASNAALVCAVGSLLLAGCGQTMVDDSARSDTTAEQALVGGTSLGVLSDGVHADSVTYRVIEQGTQPTSLRGRVRVESVLLDDTLTRVTHDAPVCTPTPDAPVRGSAEGIIDAIVWLEGVRAGPADSAPRRTVITFGNCRLSPRVQRVPVGATMLVRSADQLNARIRFLSPRAPNDVSSNRDEPVELVPLSEAGTVVPSTRVAARPGLVEILDDHHPWVRGWVLVAPHPFAVVTNASGEFDFSGVPVGTYRLMAWHERLGVSSIQVVVERGVATHVVVTLPGEAAKDRSR